MDTARPLALALLLALGLLSSGSRIGAAAQDQPPEDISPAALAQIDALMAEKDSRTPEEQKIDSQLIYERKMEAGQSVAAGIWVGETDLPYADAGHLVYGIDSRFGEFNAGDTFYMRTDYKAPNGRKVIHPDECRRHSQLPAFSSETLNQRPTRMLAGIFGLY